MEKLEKEKNFLSVVLYASSDSAGVSSYLEKLDDTLSAHFLSYEYIIVNDANKEWNVSDLTQLAENIEGNVTVINMAWKHGVELAMYAGLELAIGDFVIEFDEICLDYETEEILKIYYKCLEGFDIVAAVPSKRKPLSSRIFYSLMKYFSHHKVNLDTERFRVVSRRALNRMLASKEKFRYRKLLYLCSGFSYKIDKYDVIETVMQGRKQAFRERVNFASYILIKFSNAGVRIPFAISTLFFIFAIINLGYTFYSYFMLDEINPGWTSLMTFLSVSFGGIFFVLATIAKNIAIVLGEAQDRPIYYCESLDRISNK